MQSCACKYIVARENITSTGDGLETFVVSFCASFSKLRVHSVLFCYCLANKVTVKQIEQNASFGSLSRNIRYLENI